MNIVKMHGFSRFFRIADGILSRNYTPSLCNKCWSSVPATEEKEVNVLRNRTKKSLPNQRDLYNKALRDNKKMYRSGGDTRFYDSGPSFGSRPNGFSNPSYSSAFSGYAGDSGYGHGGSAYGMRNSTAGERLNNVDWNSSRLEEIVKNCYVEAESVSRRSQEEINQWISTNQITLNGNNIPRPVFEFSEAGFVPPIQELLYRMYQTPTLIQSISWPVALTGRDMISIARTGSGKTIGFILPAIMHTLQQSKRKPGDGPSVLVLLPTRELAQQVEEVARPFCATMGLTITCLFGGAPKHSQGSDLRRGVDLCIATPGRLLDFLETGVTNLRRCTYLVLDEADRMLDMGFEPQIRKVVGQLRPDRQTLMFSATWPKEVRRLAEDFHSDPVFLNVGSLELSANHNITQYVEVVQDQEKPRRLFDVLTKISEQRLNKTLIFVDTKRKADYLTTIMRQDGWPALCIHGDKSQSERDWVMQQFRSGKAPILLATDVASRGLDVQDIAFVINYDYPNNSEDYVHRIGRTGRSDRTGVAYTFFSYANAPKARDLIKVLDEAGQNIPEDLMSMAGSNNFSGSNSNTRYRRYGGGGNGGMYGGNQHNYNNGNGRSFYS